MNKKFYVVCISLFISLFAFIVVFHGFSSQQTGSGSSSKVAPSVKFKAWSAGRSSGTDTSDAEHLSFITSTGTSCQFSASVGYLGGSTPPNTSPIDPSTVTWTVPKASHKMVLDTSSVSSNWTGADPSQLNTNTSFNVVGKLTVPAHRRTSRCTANDAQRAQRRTVHREGKSMSFTLTFTAQTVAGHTVTASLPLQADNKDQIRQEYVDLNKPIPSRDGWVDSDTYDFGHYGLMRNEGLDDNFQSWIDAMNKRERTGKTDKNGNPLSTLKKGDFGLNSGYRNPHHNVYHAGSGGLSAHMYGYALDVNGRDIDGKTGADQQKMVNAAYAAEARFSQRYPNKTHVHADWAPDAPVKWKHRKKTADDPPTLSLPSGGTTITATVACEKERENNCDVQVSSSSEHYVTCGDSECGKSYWSCDSYDYSQHRLRRCTNKRLPGGRDCDKTWRRCQYPPERIPNTHSFAASPNNCVTAPTVPRYCSENGVITTPGGGAPTVPAMHACGVHATSESGNHQLVAANSWSLHCTTHAFYACQASEHEWSTATCGDSTHANYICLINQDHSTTISGYSGTFYECQPHQTFACGHTDLMSNSYTHRSETCPTDSNGQACSSGSYYACQSHTHVYPAPAPTYTCNGCNATVTRKLKHLKRCSSCNKLYYECKSFGLQWHTKVKTCRRTKNGVPCNQTFTSCSNTNTCFYGWKHTGVAHNVE